MKIFRGLGCRAWVFGNPFMIQSPKEVFKCSHIEENIIDVNILRTSHKKHQSSLLQQTNPTLNQKEMQAVYSADEACSIKILSKVGIRKLRPAMIFGAAHQEFSKIYGNISFDNILK
ncbi:hypothetical protein RF11_10830 [Thelohanellus kitauei]|uniref:Uncharacterized protein n=1 Tax=Thelohanellus kitauei TaxID=669202 RepID=A0A0C2MZI2_THEKT|nr:hypothetical protein RF11_10830 [Thelohanellus kitauei]